MTGRRGRKRRKLLDDFKERRGYCNLKEEALDHTGCILSVVVLLHMLGPYWFMHALLFGSRQY